MAILINQVRRTFYMDSVALMRISRSVSELPGVVTAALMIGSATNKTLMRDAKKRAALKTRGDTGGARAGWRAPRGRGRDRDGNSADHSSAAPAEALTATAESGPLAPPAASRLTR